MKNIAKLSLVASLAIAASAANAQDLTEAIKNVDVSGTVVYRYDDREDRTGDSATNSYKIAVNVSSKVNDDVTANTRFIMGDNTGMFSKSTSNTGDENIDVQLSEVNFTYTGVNNLSVTVGKQGIATPFTVARDSAGGESTGTGILASYNFAPITVAGAYFNQTNIAAATDLYAFALLGSFAGISADAWYLDADDVYDIYTLGLSANYTLGSVALSPSVRFTSQDYDANNNDSELLKVELKAKMGMFDAYIGYGKTGDDAGVNVDGYSSSMVLDPHFRVGLFDQADADGIFANIGAQVTDKLHVSVRHSDVDAQGTTDDAKETYGQVVYKMSSNFMTYVRLGEYKKEGQEGATSGRLHVQYSF